MIIDTTLKRISRNEKTSKAGKPYVSLGIQIPEHGENWINSFGNKENAAWKEGDEVKIDVFEEEYQGKKYLKFKMVELKDILLARVIAIEAKLEKLRPMYQEWKEKADKTLSNGDPMPFPDEIDPESIPF